MSLTTSLRWRSPNWPSRHCISKCGAAFTSTETCKHLRIEASSVCIPIKNSIRSWWHGFRSCSTSWSVSLVARAKATDSKKRWSNSCRKAQQFCRTLSIALLMTSLSMAAGAFCSLRTRSAIRHVSKTDRLDLRPRRISSARLTKTLPTMAALSTPLQDLRKYVSNRAVRLGNPVISPKHDAARLSSYADRNGLHNSWTLLGRAPAAWAWSIASRSSSLRSHRRRTLPRNSREARLRVAR